MTTYPSGRADCIESVGAVLIVFDDGSRAHWERTVPAGFRLRGIRPDERDRDRIAEHLGHGGRLLVVLAHEHEPVCALAEEVPDLPDQAAGDPGIVELRIDQLDWLGEAHRPRGTEFVRRERARYEATPPLARAAVALSEEVDGVSFLLRSPSTTADRVRRELPAIVAWASRRRSSEAEHLDAPAQIGDLHALRG